MMILFYIYKRLTGGLGGKIPGVKGKYKSHQTSDE